MKRIALILSMACILGAVAFTGSFLVSREVCCPTANCSADDLDWLRHEFQLSDAELTRIRKLHEGYRPQCTEMCAQVTAKQSELEEALTGATNLNAAIETKLAELHALRARCETQMLKHFMEVSQAMPAEQGRRYLAEMQKLTLGDSGPCNQTMCTPTGHAIGSD